MATLTVMTPTAAGSTLALVAATAGAGGDKYLNTGKEVIIVNNGSGAPITVTIVGVQPCNHGILHDETWSVLNGTTEYHSPVRADQFNDDTGYTKITFSAATSVTVGVMKAT